MIKTKLMKVIPNNKLSYEQLIQFTNENRYYEIYYVPIRTFEAPKYDYFNPDSDKKN